MFRELKIQRDERDIICQCHTVGVYQRLEVQHMLTQALE